VANEGNDISVRNDWRSLRALERIQQRLTPAFVAMSSP
jgi:hypothetical protein